MSLLRLTQDTSQPQADLAGVYDAIVIRSGAAGGMAAHVLTSQGMQVLLLEAGRKLRQELEYRGNTYQAEFSGVDVSQER